MDMGSLSVKDALQIALAKEEKARAAYLQIESKVKNSLLKEKAAFLAGEELKHHKLLETIFKTNFPTQKPEIPTTIPVLWAYPDVAPDASVPELLEAAMKAELDSEEFYKALAGKVENRSAKAIYNYLAAMERGHYYLVMADYELTKEVDSYWDLQEMSEGFLMTHMGA